jgi:glycosyltransferase involved in cell wall biosynthesis
MTPKVTIIIPTYNCDRYIAEAIESVLKQTYTQYEIIVIDDGSTDNTRQVLEPYIEKIHYIYQENQGVAIARNHGIQEASGEFIAFLDADDFWILPTKLEEQVACFHEQPEVGIVQSGWRFVNQWREKIFDKEPWQDADELNLKAWLLWGHVLPSAIMIRKEWLERIDGFDSRFPPSEDLDIILRLSLMGCKSVWLKKITVGYRQHPDNATKRLRKQAVSMSKVWDNFFSQPQLPDEIRQLEPQIRYYNLIWVAFLHYEAKQFVEMAGYLRTSLTYNQYSTASETIAHWVESFKRSTDNYTGHSFDIYSLTNLPEWQELTKSILVDNFINTTPKIRSLADKINEKYYACKSNLNLPLNSSCYPAKLNLFNHELLDNFGEHRSGWYYAIKSIKCLQHDSGILVDLFVENNFCWWMKTPFERPWIGFMHNPQNMPKWFKYNQSPQALFSSKIWQESAPLCQGLFCLSRYHKYWLQKQIEFNITIVDLIHPTETPEIKFSIPKFLANPDKKLVQVGWWLRRLHSIYYLPLKYMKKARLRVNQHYVDEVVRLELREYSIRPNMNEVEVIDRLSNAEYDELLSQNIVYLDLYDSSANNAIIECIVRNTPVLVNPLPAVKEYLGEDYPFYFESRSEAAKKAEDFSLVEATHQYLKEHPIKEKLTADYFLKSVAESTIYQHLSI